MTVLTDLESHHIEGFTAGGYIKLPLITEILPDLWMGGCVHDVRLPDDFGYVLSLYPWEKYELGPDTQRREVRLYDAADVPDAETLDSLALLVNTRRAECKTLVHCQAGLNRSGLVTALALIASDYEPAEAIALLRAQRSPMVLCNQVFENYLLS